MDSLLPEDTIIKDLCLTSVAKKKKKQKETKSNYHENKNNKALS